MKANRWLFLASIVAASGLLLQCPAAQEVRVVAEQLHVSVDFGQQLAGLVGERELGLGGPAVGPDVEQPVPVIGAQRRRHIYRRAQCCGLLPLNELRQRHCRAAAIRAHEPQDRVAQARLRLGDGQGLIRRVHACRCASPRQGGKEVARAAANIQIAQLSRHDAVDVDIRTL